MRVTQAEFDALTTGTPAKPARRKGKPPAPTTPSEKEIQSNILEWLAFVRIFAWRNMTGGAMLKGGHFRRFGIVGGSDIIGLIQPDGKMLAIEVKKPGGKPSVKQLEFLARVNAQGGLGFIARSVEDVQAKLKAEGVIL